MQNSLNWFEESEDKVLGYLGGWKLKREFPEKKAKEKGAPKSAQKLHSNTWLTFRLCMCTGDSRSNIWKAKLIEQRFQLLPISGKTEFESSKGNCLLEQNQHCSGKENSI